MVFYFSATGNSLWVANKVSHSLNEPLVSIAEALQQEKTEYTLCPNERVFFIYPVHSWGPAILVNRFIKKMNLKGYVNQSIFSIATCGSDCANTTTIIKKWLAVKNILLTASYSITMPNTYILMRGFYVDSKDIVQAKIKDAPNILIKIIQAIKNEKYSVKYYNKTSFPLLKSALLYPAFVRFTIGKNKFHSTEKCISCGLCEKICPTDNIKLINKIPVWNDSCVQCSACIHRCPMQAIEYGKITKTKQRYIHPDLK